MSDTPPTVNDAINAAKDLPTLLQNLSVVSPDLAAQLTKGASMTTTTPIGAAIGLAVGWVSTKYSLGWDQHTCEVVTLLAMIGGSYVAHWIATLKTKSVIAAASTGATS